MTKSLKLSPFEVRERTQEEWEDRRKIAEGHPFGTSPQNPILCHGVSSEYLYLRSIQTRKGAVLNLVCQALIHTPIGALDQMTMAYLEDGVEHRVDLYFDFTAGVWSREEPTGLWKLPEGFIFRNFLEIPGFEDPFAAPR